MGRKTQPLLPRMTRLLGVVGENIQLARRRRRLTSKQVAERAGMTVVTLRAVERGSPGVTLGAYAAVLQVLGLENDLLQIAQADPLGRKLQDAGLLPPRERGPGGRT